MLSTLREPPGQKYASDMLPGFGPSQPPTDGLADRISAAEGRRRDRRREGPPDAQTSKLKDQDRYELDCVVKHGL